MEHPESDQSPADEIEPGDALPDSDSEHVDTDDVAPDDDLEPVERVDEDET